MLNKKRLEEAWSRCIPLFTWDPDLASSAQAWADQCALVEYSANESMILPERLHHDPSRQKASGHLAIDAGVAQSVHWARTGDLDLNGKILEALVKSDITTEDGLFDGLVTNLPKSDHQEENFVAFGQATHVGCGWIQFPTSEDGLYENFMVCNYGVGLTTKTSCDNMTKNEVNDHGTLIKYFTVTSEVIRDVKACLEAVRCRRRKKKLFKTFESSRESNENDPCTLDVQKCLKGRSGLKFVDATKLRSVARSNEDRPIDVEAAKCKIDTILCSLNTTIACKERLEQCLPLIEIEADKGSNVLCECSDLILADGTRGDCSQNIQNPESGFDQPFCFVKQSPCVVIDPKDGGHLELSKPYMNTNGLLHYTHYLC